MSTFESSRRMTQREQTAYDMGYQAGKHDAVVHGEWIPIEHEYRNKFERVMIADEFDCGICGRRLGYRANYCPNCGSQMDGKGGEGK